MNVGTDDRRRRWALGFLLALLLLCASPLVAQAACTTSGALQEELANPASSRPGGVDFSTLQLRYVSDVGSGSTAGVKYAFSAVPTTGPQNAAAGQQAMQESLDSLFVWLELPASQFTVNLNPTEPDRIIDADFGRTDAGRTLLEADFAMKKTVAALIHPDTPLGSQYWAALQAAPDGSICASMRQWIVPAPATVREDGSNLYILDAPLSVKMETEYLQGQSVAGNSSCASQPQSITAHNEQVYRSMILPRVEQAVNQAPEYASLRRVYLSRVAAEWYRKRAASQLSGNADVSSLESLQPWNPKDVFDQYVRSYTNGEFTVTHQSQQGNEILTQTYVYGGVDFSTVPMDLVSDAAFKSAWAGLPERASRSVDRPTADPQHGLVWMGGTAAVATHTPGPLDRLSQTLAPLSRFALPLVIGVLALVAALAGALLTGKGRRGGQAGTLSILLLLALVAGAQAQAFDRNLPPAGVVMTAWADQGTGQVDYGSTPLSQAVQGERLNDRNWGNTYAAARLSDGTVIFGKSSSAGHAEQDVIAQAGGRTITDVYVEFEPCKATCAPALAKLPGVRVTWSWPWNGSTPAETAAIRADSRLARAAAITELRSRGAPGTISSTEKC